MLQAVGPRFWIQTNPVLDEPLVKNVVPRSAIRGWRSFVLCAFLFGLGIAVLLNVLPGIHRWGVQRVAVQEFAARSKRKDSLPDQRPWIKRKRGYYKGNATTAEERTTLGPGPKMFGKDATANETKKVVLRVGLDLKRMPYPKPRFTTDKKMSRVCLETSTDNPDMCPQSDGRVEVAFIGRSNVGKSSLVNTLTLSASHAAVSAVPGSTRHIDQYLVDNKWRLVDLPGYGPEQGLTEAVREKWDRFTRSYLSNRTWNLALVFLLLDSSRAPTKSDLEYADWLINHEIPFAIVLTKCDLQKSGPNVTQKHAEFREYLTDNSEEDGPAFIPTSAVTKFGRQNVLRFISSVIQWRASGESKRLRKQKRIFRVAERMRTDDKYREHVLYKVEEAKKKLLAKKRKKRRKRRRFY